VIGSKEMEWIASRELRHFYRTPTQCWRGRYRPSRARRFKLDLDKLSKQDRYSDTEGEKGDSSRTGKPFLFWDDFPSGRISPPTARRSSSIR